MYSHSPLPPTFPCHRSSVLDCLATVPVAQQTITGKYCVGMKNRQKDPALTLLPLCLIHNTAPIRLGHKK